MLKKIIWLFISCLMLLSLVVASCGPSQPEEGGGGNNNGGGGDWQNR